MQQALGPPRPPQTRPTLTKQLSMEQETREVRLMVAGGLGQRTCPRSCCAARQCQAPAASRLRGPPGAAAATRRLALWRRGLGAAPARLSPPLHNGASPAPPSGTSAEGRGARRGERPGPGEEGGCGSSRPRPPLQAPPSSRPLGLARGRPQGTSGGFRSLGCGTAPRPRESV